MTNLNKIDKNCDVFEHKNKIKTDLTKFDENWDKFFFNQTYII